MRDDSKELLILISTTVFLIGVQILVYGFIGYIIWHFVKKLW